MRTSILLLALVPLASLAILPPSAQAEYLPYQRVQQMDARKGYRTPEPPQPLPAPQATDSYGVQINDGDLAFTHTQRNAPAQPAPLTREEMESIIEKKLREHDEQTEAEKLRKAEEEAARKAAESAAKAQAEEEARNFGPVGGLGNVGFGASDPATPPVAPAQK